VSRARYLAIAGALLCVLAALFAVPALYIPGLAALLAAAVAPVWVRLAAARARVTLRAAVTTVQEGERVALSVSVRRGLIPFPAVALRPWPGADAVAPPTRRRGEIAATAVVSRRGRQTLGPASLRVADPLGICVRELHSAEHELLVLPRVYPINAPALGGLEDRGRSPLDAALEVDSLRPYSAGGPASRIHWPAVARTGNLMERSFTAETDPRVLVMLDARLPESEETLDQALRATASLCVHLARRGGCLLLLPDDRQASVIGPDLRSWPALHARLALVQPGAGVPRADRSRHPRTVLYVTASARIPAFGGQCYRVGPRPLAGLDVAFTVAGLTGQVVNGARARSA
jgi:uncharacterized protein (DUF58 family)